MSPITVYGAPMSRAARTLWICRELGVEYESKPLHFAGGELRSEEFLAINPNGRVPAITDGDFQLWESMAINLYLARKYGAGSLALASLEEEAEAWQWSFWVMTEIEKPLLAVLLRRMEFPEGSVEEEYFRARYPEDPEAEAADVETLQRPLAVLNGHLEDRDFLVAERFTVADLNVASVLAWALPARLDLSGHPRVSSWLRACTARPAYAG